MLENINEKDAKIQMDKLEDVVKIIKKDKNHEFACVITTTKGTRVITHGNSTTLLNLVRGCGKAIVESIESLDDDVKNVKKK